MAEFADLSKQYKQMAIDSQDINILLMGETGVGKSTFINAFANYMEYDKFNVAEASPCRCLIPSSFNVTDENMQEIEVKIGRDKNENEEVGESATQGARSYVFSLPKYNKKRIRLIDTPGVGDTRGIDQDSVNFENILNYIGNMEYLHAICFLLKPNNSRITVFFEYCIKQLLSRLEKSASKNIIFLFTNSRSTFYRPGDTAPALKKILAQIKSRPPHVDILFEKENVFCLDNEAFRFMVSCKNGVNFTNQDKESFSRSWDQSVSECWRMIDYITGEGSGTRQLTPHKVQDTISVNNARRIIIQLSQPLADIADLINDNINLLQRHNDVLKTENMSMTKLKERLFVPIVNLRHKELTQPTTVCTSKDCSEIYMVGDKKKYHYKQRCHDPCYLQNVPQEIIGSPELVNCYAINKSTKKCNECDCDFSTHMHIYYETETFEDKITDTGVKSQITDRETAVQEAQKLIATIETRKHDYEEEKEIIVKNMAKFAHFLQHNAIAPYNDAYKAYIEYLIDRENSYGPDADTQLIMYYRDLLKQYHEEKHILDDALKMSKDGNSSVIKSSDVFEAVRTLYNLKHTGEKIRELHEQQRNSRKAEYEDNTEYVLDEMQQRCINPSIKGVSKKKQPKGIPSEVREQFGNLLEQFPEMEEILAQKYQSSSQQFDDDEHFSQDGTQQPNNKARNKNQNQGAYKKKCGGKYDNQKPNNQQKQNRRNNEQYQGPNQGRVYQIQGRGRGRGEGYGRGRGEGYGRGRGEGYGRGHGYNPGPGNLPQNSGPNGPYNSSEGDGFNQGHGQWDSRWAPPHHNQQFHNYNQGPPNYNQQPPNFNRGPPPSPYSQEYPNSGPYNHRPPPYGLQNQGRGPREGFPEFGPEQRSNQPQNLHNQGQNPYNQGHGSSDRREANEYSQAQHLNNKNFGTNNFGKDDQQRNMNKEQKQNNVPKPSVNRPMGPYKPDINDKTSNVNLPHMNKFLNDCGGAQDDPEEEDGDFDDFMKRHGLDSDNKTFNTENQARGANSVRSRGRNSRNRGGRGGRRQNRKGPKSLDELSFDGFSESESEKSIGSAGRRKTNIDHYKRADQYQYVPVDNQKKKEENSRGQHRSISDILKSIFN